MTGKTEPKSDRRVFRLPGEAVRGTFFWLAIFMGIALWRYLAIGHFFFFRLFGYIGFSVACGALLSKGLVRKYKPWGRRISQILVGLFMFGFLSFPGHENMQSECILCDSCANICPTDAIKSTSTLDFGWDELVNIRTRANR